MKKLILGSGSPRRKELMAQIGLQFEVIVSDADENISETWPDRMVMELSKNKAEAVWNSLDEKSKAESIVIGADTIVYNDGKVLGKPKDEEDAYNMIKSLQDGVHSVYTGVTLYGEEVVSFFEETKVYVYPMTDEEITGYIATKDPMDKAGAYGIQGLFAAFVKGIEGDYNNVVGLPVARVYQELKKAGYLNE